MRIVMHDCFKHRTNIRLRNKGQIRLSISGYTKKKSNIWENICAALQLSVIKSQRGFRGVEHQLGYTQNYFCMCFHSFFQTGQKSTRILSALIFFSNFLFFSVKIQWMHMILLWYSRGSAYTYAMPLGTTNSQQGTSYHPMYIPLLSIESTLWEAWFIFKQSRRYFSLQLKQQIIHPLEIKKNITYRISEAWKNLTYQ